MIILKMTHGTEQSKTKLELGNNFKDYDNHPNTIKYLNCNEHFS